MAKTFPLKQVEINLDDDAFLGGRKWTYQEEGSGQDFVKNEPLLFNAGQVDETASPPAAGTLAAFAMEDASGVQATLIKTIDIRTVLAFGGVEANLVDAVNPITDHVYAQADLGVVYDLQLDPVTGFWVAIAGAGTNLRSWDRKSSHLFPDEEEDRAEIGDTNPRLYFKVLTTAAFD